MRQLISVVVPCYNEEEALGAFYEALNNVTKAMDYVNFEIIFVDDGSTDKTLELLKSFSKMDHRVHYLSLSRDFGKEAAMYAGFKASRGDLVCTMDADLQDPPMLLPVMYKAINEEGYDCVATRRVSRQGEPKLRSFMAHQFYKIINQLSTTKIVDGARDYRLMIRPMVDAIVNMKEYDRFSKGLFSFVGFKTKWLSYDNVERVAGKTKWSFFKLFKYAISGFINFSTVLLIVPIFLGLIALSFAIIYLIVKLCLGTINDLSIIIIIMTGLFGILFIMIGLIGEYLSRLYLEVKGRPIYIIRETDGR